MTNQPYFLSGESHHIQILIGLDYNLLILLLLRELEMLLQPKFLTMGHLRQHSFVIEYRIVYITRVLYD